MVDLPPAVAEALLKLLECPVCMEYIVSPIKLCTNGHNICSKCRQRVQYCPICRAECSEIRSVMLDNIVGWLKYPCINRRHGCLGLFSCEHITEHQAVCMYREIRCPSKFTEICPWNGLQIDLKNHAKVAHSANFLEVSEFQDRMICGGKMGLKFLSCFGQLFMVYRESKSVVLFCDVQLIGTSSEASKYSYELTLHEVNGNEKVYKSLEVGGYSGDRVKMYFPGIWLCLDEVKQQIVENKLNVSVKLCKV